MRDRHAWVYRSVGLSRTGCAPTKCRPAALIRYPQTCVPLVGAHLCATAALGRTAPPGGRAQVRSYKKKTPGKTGRCIALELAFGSWPRGSPYDAAGGWRKARRVAAWMRPVFRQDRDVLSKNPLTRTRTWRAKGPEGASSGGPFLLVTFLYSGHPALRPSGRLRRSHALLRVRGQAKKSNPASGRRTEARGRRARSRSRDNQTPRL